MILAFASGKGGTGKTSVSVSFALSHNSTITFLDCDVEEPNAHFFIKPDISAKETVSVPVPAIDPEKCTSCGICSEVCEFNAIVQIKQKVLVFQELCHSCNGCILSCPSGAISETPSPIGTVYSGKNKGISFHKGELQIGKAMSPPLIRAIKKMGTGSGDIILDCPPGTACPMVTAVKGADYVILVTEPTPFGLHDLKLAVETVRELGIPFGIIINRDTEDNSLVDDFCRDNTIPVLMKVPENRNIAEAYSVGKSMCEAYPEIVKECRSVFASVKKTTRKKIK